MDTGDFSIGQLAELAGISTRALRHYEDMGMLVPKRTENNYRRYGEADARRLAQILAMRSCGMSLTEIKGLLFGSKDVSSTLHSHLCDLHARRQVLEDEISRTEEAIAKMERMANMKAEQSFEELKREGLREFEETYGKEAREKYGVDVIEEANERLLRMNRKEWDAKEDLEQEILRKLRAAMAGGDPSSDEAGKLVRSHRAWVGIHWGCEPTKDAYSSLVNGYACDPRFVEYYDSRCGEGATAFLIDAVNAQDLG